MRELTSHVVNGLNERLEITVRDEPGPGNGNHLYHIAHDCGEGRTCCHIVKFQNGLIGESGANGVSDEALLAIVEDRLKGFQSGEYACRENAIALTHIQDAMHWLHHWTRERVARGVEGTSQK